MKSLRLKGESSARTYNQPTLTGTIFDERVVLLQRRSPYVARPLLGAFFAGLFTLSGFDGTNWTFGDYIPLIIACLCLAYAAYLSVAVQVVLLDERGLFKKHNLKFWANSRWSLNQVGRFELREQKSPVKDLESGWYVFIVVDDEGREKTLFREVTSRDATFAKHALSTKLRQLMNAAKAE